jgi:hypothetical protein
MEEARNLKAIATLELFNRVPIRYMAGVTIARLAHVACKRNIYLVCMHTRLT